MKSKEQDLYIYPSFLRRLAAMLYDSILLIGLFFLALLPMPAIPEHLIDSNIGIFLLRVYLLLVMYWFFGWFWTHRGQTLGMRAWNVKVITNDGGNLNWFDSLKRFVLAFISFSIAGLGFLYCIISRNNLTLHDKFSGSKLVMINKQ